jgi:hypothetical protein
VLEGQVRRLRHRLARYEPRRPPPAPKVGEPPRRLSAEEVQRETQGLLAVCVAEGVEAAAAEAVGCRELLRSLADACFRCGLVEAGQYLNYLEAPYD